MKRIIGFLAIALVVIGFLSGCSQKPALQQEPPEPQPMAVMINGVIYYNTQQTIGVRRCGVMDGEITSEVSVYELPQKDDQSNFGKGYEYQMVDEHHYDVPMDNPDGWIRFCDSLCDEDHSLPIANPGGLCKPYPYPDGHELCGYPPMITREPCIKIEISE